MLSLKELIPALAQDFTKGITRVDRHIYIHPTKEHKYTFIWVSYTKILDAWIRGCT
jgi:phospholipase/carboxylesterase